MIASSREGAHPKEIALEVATMTGIEARRPTPTARPFLSSQRLQEEYVRCSGETRLLLTSAKSDIESTRLTQRSHPAR